MKTIKKLAALLLAGVICMSTLSGCAIDPEKTAATLGEESISLGFVNFMAKYNKANMDDYYNAYGSYLGVTDIWDTDMSGSGETLKESLVESVVSYIHDLYTLKAHMSEYKVALTDEQTKAIKDAADKFMKGNTPEALKEMGATEEYVIEYLTLATIEALMYDAIILDVDTNVNDKEANMRGYSYIEISLKGAYNEDNKYESYTEAQKKEIREKAEKMEEEMKTSSFTDVADKYEYDVKTGAYSTFEDDTTMNATLLKELKKLELNEVSGVIEIDTSLYFLKIDAETDEKATQEKREEIIEEREVELYNDTMDKWQKEDGWVEYANVIDDIKFHDNFTLDDGSTESEKDTDTEKDSEKDTDKESEKSTDK